MDETFTYAALEDSPSDAIATFDGGTGNDTLEAGWIGSDHAGSGLLTEFTLNPDGSFTARYYDLRGNSVTITNIENVHIHAVNGYHETVGGDLIRVGYRDVIITGGGDDVIFTDRGYDFVNAGSGINIIDGGDQDDFISANLSAVTTNILWNLVTNTYSGPGSYTNLEYFVEVTTGSGNDTVVSGGPDSPYTSVTGAGPGVIGGDELISTGAGNDRVTVLQGNDTVNLGSGRDRMIIDYRDGAFNANSTLSITQTSAGTYSGSMVTTQNSNADGVIFTGAEDFTVMTDDSGGNGYNSVDNITTGDGNDIVFTYHSDDLIHVGRGTDQVDGGTFVDGLAKEFNLTDTAINFNLLANTFSGRGSFVNIEYFINLRATNGNDVIVTSLFSDSASTRGDDTIFTYGGNDTVTLSNDDDTVDMGAGDDRLILDYSVSSFQGDMTLAITGAGTYSGTFNGEFANRSQVAFAGVEHFTVRTNQTTGSTYGSNDTVTTGNGNDVVFTYHSDDLIHVGTGTDQVDGGIHLDGLAKEFDLTDTAIIFNLLANTFSGRGSFTNIEYFIELRATNGNDVIVTGLANVPGSTQGNDTIYTYGGNDTVTLSEDDDTVDMGAGDDRLILDYSASSSQGATTLAISGVGTYSGTFNGRYANDAQVTFAGVEHFTVRTVETSSSVDTVTTGNGNDVVFTFGGADIIATGAGNDFIDAGSGNDHVDAGAGNDTVIGGSNDDNLTGGSGTDLVSYRDAVAGVTVNLALTIAQVTGYGTDILAGFENLQGSNFGDRLTGNAGDNRIDGRLGADVLRGLGGNDTFVFAAALVAGNIDRIVDFNVADDRFLLSDSVFTALNPSLLTAAELRINTTGLAQDANDHIIYNTATGALVYDADGTGATAGIQFATLTAGLALTNADFFID